MSKPGREQQVGTKRDREKAKEEEGEDEFVMVLIICVMCTVTNSGLRLREGNIVRDRYAAMERLASYSAKDFRRRFRMHRWQFEFMCDLIRADVEVDAAGKLQAIRSSGSYSYDLPPHYVFLLVAVTWMLEICSLFHLHLYGHPPCGLL